MSHFSIYRSYFYHLVRFTKIYHFTIYTYVCVCVCVCVCVFPENWITNCQWNLLSWHKTKCMEHPVGIRLNEPNPNDYTTWEAPIKPGVIQKRDNITYHLSYIQLLTKSDWSKKWFEAKFVGCGRLWSDKK